MYYHFNLARELPEVEGTTKGQSYKGKFSSGDNDYYAKFSWDPWALRHEFTFGQQLPDDQDEHGITGAGNAMETMTKVAAHFVHGLRTLKPKVVTFSAEEPSRRKLYDAMVKHLPRFAPEYEVEDGGEQGKSKLYKLRRRTELSRGWDGSDLGMEDQSISGPEGWIDADGNYHANEPGPYGVRHDDTIKRLGYPNVGSAFKAGLMHLASPDGTQLLGHRSDRNYTAPQLRKLKSLAAQHSLEPAITTTQNGMVTTRSLKLSRHPREGEPTDKLDREAFGFTSGDMVTVDPKEVTPNPDDLENAVYQSERHPKGPKAWARSVSQKEPVDLHYKGGKLHLNDGHHRYLAAKILGKKLKGVVTVKDNPLLSLARPGAHGLISPEGDHHPLGMYGLQSHDNLARQLGHEDALDAQAKGFMHVSSDFDHNLIGHNENRKYTLPQLKKLKSVASEHGYLGAGVTEGNKTRMLKLSSVDRLWENVHKDPTARMILADYLEEDGEPALAHIMRNVEPWKSEFQYRPGIMLLKGGEGERKKFSHPHIHSVSGVVNNHPTRFSSVMFQTKHMGPNQYLRSSDAVSNQDILKFEHELSDQGKLELAAEKAPAGGMVSNNQFYEGGKFLPRALKSIREVRNRKLANRVKLSRDQDLHNLFHDWRLEKTEMKIKNEHGVPVTWDIPKNQHHLIAADVLQENSDLPSSPLHEFLRDARPGLPMMGNVNVMTKAVRQPAARDPELRRDINNYRRPRLASRLKSLEDSGIGIHRVYFHHDPGANKGHIIVAMQTGHNDEGKYPTRAYTWHAPATKEQLQALGAKSKRMKLSRAESLWQAMADNPNDEGIRGILADHLEENQHPGLAEFIRDPKTYTPSENMFHRNRFSISGHPHISHVFFPTPYGPEGKKISPIWVKTHVGQVLRSPNMPQETVEKIKSELMSPE